MDAPFLGMIVPMALNFAPRGWASCEGQLQSISQNTALFSLLNTTFGGDGKTTFGLPDLRGRSIVGIGQGPGLSNYAMGQSEGSYTTTLTVNNLPAHNHVMNFAVNSLGANLSDPTGNFVGGGGPNIFDSTADTTLNAGVATAAGAGGGMPLNIQNPSLAMYYNIAVQGMYPSRN